MCGKDVRRLALAVSEAGSPPHVRERPGPPLGNHGYMGITPACAGKTCRVYLTTVDAWDHPRMCGKDSNGSLYFRPFTPADIQNLFNFFAKHLTSSASPNAR